MPDIVADPSSEVPSEAFHDFDRISASLVSLVRRANDPRGNRNINRAAGVHIERAGAVMLARVEELEPARLSELADAAGVEVSTASRQVAKLVDDGYITRTAHPDDGRASAHRLTAEGRDIRERLRTARRAWYAEVMRDFSDADRDRLANLLEQFVERMTVVDRP